MSTIPSPVDDVESPWKAPIVGKRPIEVVLVTGASGFLGQHIVRMLQEKDKEVKEIRCFDIKPYKNKLGHSTDKAMKTIVGDLTKERQVTEACAGVDCVIHAGALVDISLFPNTEALEAVNVDGTRHVIDGCIKQNVPYLVYTSTADVVVSGNHIFYGAENTTFTPKQFLMGPYAETKHRAEQLVLHANNRVLADGATKIRTLALRPTVLYGEQDSVFITNIIKTARWAKRRLTKVRYVDERFQITYAGNAANAHLDAMRRLRQDDTLGGEYFFITDDTPLDDFYEFIRPFVEAQGCKITNYTLPYYLVVFFISLLALCVKIIRPIYKLEWNLPTPESVTYVCTSVFFNRTKATLRLGYYPVFTVDESVERSLNYYKSLKFD